jgi:hypothetical protein
MFGWSVILAIVAIVLRASVSPLIVIGVGSVVIWAVGAQGLGGPGDPRRLLGYDRSLGSFLTRWPIIVIVVVVAYLVLGWTGRTLHVLQ